MKMKPEMEEQIEQLKIRNAQERLSLFGRLLVDGRELTLWEQDTEILPRAARKWRRRARRFAREEIRPLAPEADRDPHGFDPKPFIKKATKKGFQTLMFTPPIGRAGIRTGLRRAHSGRAQRQLRQLRRQDHRGIRLRPAPKRRGIAATDTILSAGRGGAQN